MRFTLATALVTTALTAHAAEAETIDLEAVRACHAITSDLGRLACFDKLGTASPAAAQTPAAPPPAPTTNTASSVTPPAPASGQAATGQSSPSGASPAGTGAWLHRQTRDGLDQSVVETVALPSASGNVGLINKPGMRVGPVLVIRCKEKQTAAFVAFDLPITGSESAVPVQFRIGDTPPRSAAWGRAQDNEAIGFWDSARAVALVESLLGQKDLYVRASPPNKFQSEAEFKLEGIDAAVQPVRAACGW